MSFRIPDILTPLAAEKKKPYYDAQQVCVAGHQITAAYHHFPQHRQDFCSKCGLVTIYKCPKCQAEMRGAYFSLGVGSGSPTSVPDHCHKCGAPYPWTTNKSMLNMTATIHAERIAVELPPVLERLGLSDYWRVASSALAAFEILVKKKLEELNLPTTGDYDERVARLASALRKKGVPFDELMVSSLKTARNKVLHEGKEPTETELRDIMKYLKTTTSTLFPGIEP